MKKATTKMIEKTRTPNVINTEPQVIDLKRAVDRIQQRYGNDLDAFFRDAKASIAQRSAAAVKRSRVG